jgi:spore coat polysaccharide biosynthesis protein SpsF
MTAVILQSRLDSSRLPGKALLDLGGEPMVYRVLQALCLVPADVRVLACPEDSRDAFEPLAARAGFLLVTGSKEDVLGRYCKAIRETGADRVIRATGDNPFVFPDAAAEIDRQGREINADYAAFGDLPYGAGVESIRAEALLQAEREAVSSRDREHVCPYLYGNPLLFLLHRPPAPPRWRFPFIRITVDTAQDLERARALYTLLDGSIPTGEQVIAAYLKLERSA